jgi:hypothetical protein
MCHSNLPKGSAAVPNRRCSEYGVSSDRRWMELGRRRKFGGRIDRDYDRHSRSFELWIVTI